MLPGGSGIVRPILAHLGGQATTAFSPASRVSISELLAGIEVQSGELWETAGHTETVMRSSGDRLSGMWPGVIRTSVEVDLVSMRTVSSPARSR